MTAESAPDAPANGWSIWAFDCGPQKDGVANGNLDAPETISAEIESKSLVFQDGRNPIRKTIPMALRINLGVLCAGAALALLPACSSDNTSDDNGGGAPSTGGSNSGTGGSSTGGSSTGGSSTGGSSTGGAGTGGSSSTDVCAPFATFEDGAKGFWVRLNPDATEGTLTPTAADLDTTGSEVTIDTTGGANSTAKSVHYVGTGFTGNAAPGGINIANDLTSDDCHDATTYTGVSFWAKGTVDANAAGYAVDANIVIVYIGDGTNEMSYRAAVTTTWGNVQLAFDDAGWYAPAAVDLSAIKYVKLLVAGANFDIAYDEIGWYK